MPENALYHHLLERLGNRAKHLEQVLAHFTRIKVKRNVLLLQEGDVCRSVYFVAKGCLQVFVYDSDSNETTRDIIVENHWCSELSSFSTEQPAKENIRTLEPSELFVIDRIAFQKLIVSVSQFDAVYKQILESSYLNSVYRLNSFLSMDALDRIKWCMQHRPTLMTRLSSRIIASYLGIAPETFSRLRGKL